MQSIAQGWLLFELTSSPFYLGLFSSLRMVLLLCFFILGGLVSDRWERRKVMLWIQVIAALTALVLALLVSSKTIEVSHIFVLGAITSTTWAFEQPVRQALIPQLVRREDLVNALALNAVVWNGAGFLGPSLVGLLIGSVGIDGCFYINVVSYLAVIGALLRMHVPAIESKGQRATVLQSLYDGFGYVRQEKVSVGFLHLQYFRPIIRHPVTRLCERGFAHRGVRFGLYRRRSRFGNHSGIIQLGDFGKGGGQTRYPDYHPAGFFRQSFRLRRERGLSNRVCLPCHSRCPEHGV